MFEPKMTLQITRVTSRVQAKVAVVRPLASMRPNVLGQVEFLLRDMLAVRALEEAQCFVPLLRGERLPWGPG